MNITLPMLSSRNYAQRGKAMTAFAKQPARAVPLLQATRRTASSDLQWWIDASLQEIERQKQSP